MPRHSIVSDRERAMVSIFFQSLSAANKQMMFSTSFSESTTTGILTIPAMLARLGLLVVGTNGEVGGRVLVDDGLPAPAASMSAMSGCLPKHGQRPRRFLFPKPFWKRRTSQGNIETSVRAHVVTPLHRVPAPSPPALRTPSPVAYIFLFQTERQRRFRLALRFPPSVKLDSRRFVGFGKLAI